jgi:predicted ATPase/class 3 adenylate cyclase/DNA-binding winged helix-turn-helix (wHTH) protein
MKAVHHALPHGSEGHHAMRFVFGDCTLDTERYELRRAGHIIALEPKAFRVLTYLLRHHDRAVAKRSLLQEFWPGALDEQYLEYSLRNCLYKIRQAVGDAGTQGVVIETVRGYGYRVALAVGAFPPDALATGTMPLDQTNSLMTPASCAPSSPPLGQRQLTVLRCTLVEEPSWVRRNPDDIQMVLQAFYSTCEEVIQRLDGYIAQYDSAGLVVYFGYPMADEAAASRAVQAGLMLVDALRRLQVRGTADKRFRSSVRLGIHTGLVVVDAPATGRQQELVALGDTPQVATRLQEWAAPNTVVVSDATWRLVQGYFTGQALEPEALLDVDVPVQAYQVLGRSGAQNRLDLVPPWELTSLVGREAELALLRDRWTQTRDGLGQVVVLSGEPGIGKSRLAQAFHEHLADEPHIRLEWRCAPDAQQSPLQPVIVHWHRQLCRRPADTPADRLRTLEATLAGYGFALPEVVPLFAALLSLPLPAHYPPLALTPQRQRQQTLEALRVWLLAEVTRQPVLFIVEDVHWSDPSTLEFLTLLLDQGPIPHLLTLLTCRPEFMVPWSFRAHCTPLTLPCLSHTQAAEMIGRVSGDNVLPPEVVAQIAAKTDGVPLFIEELTKMVLESDWVQKGEDRDALNGPLLTLTIPATLHDSLMARLDRLGPVKEVAQLGATIGRTFAYDLLQAVATLDVVALQQSLRQLVEAELVYQQGIPPQATYTFKHALIRDAAVQSLLRSTRQQYHLRIAEVMEAQFADIAAHQPELLAHHYTEAGLPTQALPHYRRAGENAVARSAFREAVALFEQALEAIQHLPDNRDAMAQAIDLRIALRSALRPLGEFRRSLVALREAETLAIALNDTRRLGQVAVFLTVQFRMMGAYDQGKAVAQRVLAAAPNDGESLLHALAHQFLGIIYLDQGDYDQAIDCLEQAITALAQIHLHERDGVDLLPAVLSRVALASCHAERGAFAAGFVLGDEALRTAEAAAHPNSLMFAFWAIGRLALRQGDLPRALSLLERAVDRCRQVDIQGYFPRIAADLGAAYTLAGHVDDAVALLTQAWEQTTAPEMKGLQALCGITFGEAQMRAGRLERAHGIAEQTLSLTHTHQERGHQAYTLRLLGDLAARRNPGDMETARAFYHQALALAETLGMRPLQAHCHRALGDLYCQVEQTKQARAALSTAIKMYREMEMSCWLSQAETALGQLS